MKSNSIIKLSGITCLSLVSCSVLADQYHYNSMLIGDRASGLGGAYTAISDDAAGLYYNPAGIVYANNLKLSASVNGFHSSSQKYKGVLGGGDWTRSSSTLVPNFFGMTQKLGPGHFGFSYAVTNSDVENQDSVFTNFGNVNLFSVNINNRDSTTKIGPSYAIQLTDTFNIGATLYIHLREKETITNQWLRFKDNTFESSEAYFETSETGINPVLGFLWSPSDTLSIGLTVRKTLIISSDTKTQTSEVSNTVSDDPEFLSSDEKRELPLNIRAGIAYFPSNSFLMDIDFSYYEASSGFLSNSQETINMAAGLEYYYSKDWAFRGGVYTNNSNTPTIQEGGIDQLDHVDLTGFSLSVTKFTKLSSVTAGFSYSAGSGLAQVIGGSTDIQKLEFMSNTIFLSTSYQF